MWKSTEAWKVLDLVGRAPLRESFQVVMIKKNVSEGQGGCDMWCFFKEQQPWEFWYHCIFQKDVGTSFLLSFLLFGCFWYSFFFVRPFYYKNSKGPTGQRHVSPKK